MSKRRQNYQTLPGGDRRIYEYSAEFIWLTRRRVDTRTLEYQYAEHCRAEARKKTLTKYLTLKCNT